MLTVGGGMFQPHSTKAWDYQEPWNVCNVIIIAFMQHLLLVLWRRYFSKICVIFNTWLVIRQTYIMHTFYHGPIWWISELGRVHICTVSCMDSSIGILWKWSRNGWGECTLVFISLKKVKINKRTRYYHKTYITLQKYLLFWIY